MNQNHTDDRIQACEQALQATIATAYERFGRYRLPGGLLDVCTACCMDAELEREMHKLPLCALSERHFYGYNDSAKSDVQPEGEILYFLPRMLELLAQGARLHHSTELYLDRVGRCEAGAFSSREREALQDFALAHFSLGLEQWPPSQQSAFQGEDAFTILLMWDFAGLDIQALLTYWLACESEASTMHYVEAGFWEYWYFGRKVSNPFAADRPAYRATLESWLTAPAHRARFAGKLLALSETNVETSWMADSRCGNFKQRMESVFDAITEPT
jgi:hypothetical protein